jgi:hypothetical protein
VASDPYKFDQGIEAFSTERMLLRQLENELTNEVHARPDNAEARRRLNAVRARLSEEPPPDTKDGELILDKIAEMIDDAASPQDVIRGVMREFHMSRNAAERWVARASDQRLPIVRNTAKLIILGKLLHVADRCIEGEAYRDAVAALAAASKACEDKKEIADALGKAAATLKGKAPAARGKTVAENYGHEGVWYLMAMKCEPPDPGALAAWVKAGRPGLAAAVPEGELS